MKIPTEHLFEKTNICSPRYTYTPFTEKLSQNLLLKNSLKAKRYTYTNFPKSFPKVGELCDKSSTRGKFSENFELSEFEFSENF